MKKPKERLFDLIQYYINKDEIDEQTALRDLLTDVWHVADALELDIYSAISGAKDVYIEEKQLEGE